MKTFRVSHFNRLFLVLCSLRQSFCQDVESNNVIEDDESTNKFKLFWNVPSFQCRSYRIFFTSLAEKFNIDQNLNDDFRGDKMSILYDPGAFPAILKSESSNKVVYRNGGVPQEGNLTFHLQLYSEKVQELLPDKDFEGISVIDFESWRPIFRQNFGTLVPYKELSIKIERERHPLWPNNLIEKEATQRFESFGRKFMEKTITESKKLRPKAVWGYYAYPYCFNMNNGNTYCSSDVQKENDRMKWLYSVSDMLNPSLYLPEERLNHNQRMQLIEGRITEAQRIKKNLQKDLLILPYFWYKYQDTKNFLSKQDLIKSFAKLKGMGVNGIILWGSSNDVNSRKNCQDLYDYVENILGPIWLETMK